MTPESRPEQGIAFDLTARTKLRITGADRLRYLNGQISNDLRKASETAAIHACVLTAKGKINADIFVAADGESFLIDTDRELREGLAARLDRYVIADDVQISDVTDEFALFHVIAGNADAFPAPAKLRTSERLGCGGTDVWLRRDLHAAVRQDFATQLSVFDEDAAEMFRIERGVPRWGRELTDEIIPTEANLESSAIDYTKGCYIGQEVISRIKMSGQTNKRLCGLRAISGTALAAGMRLFTAGPEAKDVGWLTSVANSARPGKQIALGFVKRGFQTVGTRLDAYTNDETQSRCGSVEIVALPFV